MVIVVVVLLPRPETMVASGVIRTQEPGSPSIDGVVKVSSSSP